MSEVTDILYYPFTGGPAHTLAETRVGRAGMPEDHRLLLYQSRGGTDVDNPRLGRAELPGLDGITALNEGQQLTIRHGQVEQPLTINLQETLRRVFVTEYGDEVPCTDLGDPAASWFCGFLGVKGLRLARRRIGWQEGDGKPPMERAVPPLQIARTEDFGSRRQEFGSDNLRPNVLVKGLKNELSAERLAGYCIAIGPLLAEILPSPRLGFRPEPEADTVFALPRVLIGSPRPLIGADTRVHLDAKIEF